jgi:polyisoprenoid-binding protein YceI
MLRIEAQRFSAKDILMLKTLLAASVLAFGLTAMSPVVAADTYKFDALHTAVTMQYTHFGYSHPTIKLTGASGSVTLDEADPSKSSVEVTFDLTHLKSGFDMFDGHLAAEGFFNTAAFPTATFKSTSVVVTGPKTAKVTGDLTVKGVTHPVTLDVTFNYKAEHPMLKRTAVGFSATGTVLRSQFNLGAYTPMVSDEVQLYIEAEAN